MTINGIHGADTQMGQMGMNRTADSYSRSIQKQIANAQKQLQELSSNENMTLEDKMKKRQEIQKQINDLNMELRQHQMEQRRAAVGGSAKQQAKGSSGNDMPGSTGNAGKTKAGSKSAGLSQASMTAMISADSSIKQAKVQGSVATKMEGRAGILRSEIKLDQARGVGKAFARMCEIAIRERGKAVEGRAVIAHCNAPERAEQVKKELAGLGLSREIVITETAGVSTLYAGDGGIILAL